MDRKHLTAMHGKLSHPTGAKFHPVETALEELQADVTRLNEQVRRSQRLASLGTAAAMLAHEFNNVMTPVVGYAKFALNSEDPELMAKALRTTLKQADAINSMTQRILGMAVDEPVAFKSMSVFEVVDDAIGCLCRDLSKDGIRVKVSIDRQVKVWADPRRIRQVLFNLLLNARDALGGHRGTITFDAQSANDGFVRLTISDTGCGIPPDVLDSIFDPFVTTKNGDNGTGKRGTGLGLAICRDIIEEHSGGLSVRSAPDEGTTFTLTLPVARQVPARKCGCGRDN